VAPETLEILSKGSRDIASQTAQKLALLIIGTIPLLNAVGSEAQVAPGDATAGAQFY